MPDLFNPFNRMLEAIPPQGVVAFLDLQKKMLEEDLALKRTVPLNEVRSILSFCEFVTAARGNALSPAAVVSFPHLIFYRKMVARLVEANVLPAGATMQFAATFSTALSRPSVQPYNRSIAYDY